MKKKYIILKSGEDVILFDNLDENSRPLKWWPCDAFNSPETWTLKYCISGPHGWSIHYYDSMCDVLSHFPELFL